MKWIRVEQKLPKDRQCCHVVFCHDYDGCTDVWFAEYRNGKWYGCERPGGEEHLLSGIAICWMPEPDNPFASHSDLSNLY